MSDEEQNELRPWKKGNLGAIKAALGAIDVSKGLRKAAINATNDLPALDRSQTFDASPKVKALQEKLASKLDGIKAKQLANFEKIFADVQPHLDDTDQYQLYKHYVIPLMSDDMKAELSLDLRPRHSDLSEQAQGASQEIRAAMAREFSKLAVEGLEMSAGLAMARYGNKDATR